ncbi:RNA polymerase-binding protein DksA [bacterium]|nr:RNA polymerase-binding protein DksA [bacterium]MDE6224113.1 RNA polymerase-binding protein DksA [Alphaproteobacteria bacterium]
MTEEKNKVLNTIELPPNYKPSEDEEYMNPMQLEYFKRKLLKWKEELLQGSEETLKTLTEETGDTYSSSGDEVDRANDEALKQLELRARDRERKLIAKIDAALKRIEDGTFGYCEITDEPIGLKRLEARPVATMSVEAQEEHETKEKLYNN